MPRLQTSIMVCKPGGVLYDKIRHTHECPSCGSTLDLIDDQKTLSCKPCELAIFVSDTVDIFDMGGDDGQSIKRHSGI